MVFALENADAAADVVEVLEEALTAMFCCCCCCDVLQAMVFALENADAAADVVEVLEEALTLPETAPATKLARLFLVNDILHNSTAPVRNASRWGFDLTNAVPHDCQLPQHTCHITV
jgi:hypothetical protein